MTNNKKGTVMKLKSINQVRLAVGTALVSAVCAAQAALPVEATDAITRMLDDGEDLVAAYWAPIVAVTVGFLLFKLFKRGGSKI